MCTRNAGMMWWLWLTLALLLFLWLDVIGKVRQYYRQCILLRVLPGWPTHWLFGNLFQIERSEEFWRRWYGDVQKNRWRMTRMWIGPIISIVNIHHPEPLKAVLKAPKLPSVYCLFESWLGQGLLLAGGAKWFRNRRLLTPAFHFEILKPYVQVYSDCTNILLSKWEEKAARGEPVLVYEGISLLALDVVLRCAFSYKSDCQIEGKRNEYIAAVDEICTLLSRRSLTHNLLHRIEWFYMYCTFEGWQYKRKLKFVHDQAELIMNKRRVDLGLKGDKPTVDLKDVLKTSGSGRTYLDFLDVLLTAQTDDGCGLTDLEIRNEVDTFLFEGHDTTANGLTWALYLLAKHPEHQSKCREEIKSVLQGREQFEYDDLAHLEYTGWCIKESLRLYPPVHFFGRILAEDTEIDGYLIPKGTGVGVDVYSIHHNLDVWDNSEEFDPLRFHPSNTADMHPFAFIPFSAGPRNCIGQNFAMNEEKVVIASILNKFSLSLVEDHRVGIMPSVLLKALNDVKLWLKPL